MTTLEVPNKRRRWGFAPLIPLDPLSNIPLYQQLSEWFRLAILDGRMKPGQRVPSTRHLAADLKISRIPVLTAYDLLKADGYLEMFVGAGTCVARSIPEGTPGPTGPTGATPKRDKPGTLRSEASSEVVTATPARQAPAGPFGGAFRTCDLTLDQFSANVWSSLTQLLHVRHDLWNRIHNRTPMLV
jgi:GntR family transcriptional regulator/MocR family aminotransferase